MVKYQADKALYREGCTAKSWANARHGLLSSRCWSDSPLPPLLLFPCSPLWQSGSFPFFKSSSWFAIVACVEILHPAPSAFWEFAALVPSTSEWILCELTVLIRKLHLIVKGGGGHGGDCHEPLRHSCQLSRDKNRTKQNLESGKCRLCCMSLHLFFCICEHECRSASVASLFSTRASLRFADRICAMVDQGRGANHRPIVSLFFSKPQ